jgi:rare lipoprotein A
MPRRSSTASPTGTESGRWGIAGWLALAAAACAHAPQPSPVAAPGPYFEEGLASFYSDHLSGHLTASGEPYQPDALTAAHRRLPLGTQVEVVSLTSGRSVLVRINDRGPYVGGRIIDLSRAAAARIGLVGLMRVGLRLRDPPADSAASDAEPGKPRRE